MRPKKCSPRAQKKWLNTSTKRFVPGTVSVYETPRYFPSLEMATPSILSSTHLVKMCLREGSIHPLRCSFSPIAIWIKVLLGVEQNSIKLDSAFFKFHEMMKSMKDVKRGSARSIRKEISELNKDLSRQKRADNEQRKNMLSLLSTAFFRLHEMNTSLSSIKNDERSRWRSPNRRGEEVHGGPCSKAPAERFDVGVGKQRDGPWRETRPGISGSVFYLFVLRSEQSILRLSGSTLNQRGQNWPALRMVETHVKRIWPWFR